MIPCPDCLTTAFKSFTTNRILQGTFGEGGLSPVEGQSTMSVAFAHRRAWGQGRRNRSCLGLRRAATCVREGVGR
ncbi:hypothetical protein BHM03_00020197 [Ensete ventricosum]|uniref:Uncharacterized protein n=1 Tax=Ensete ventricosum TaxID=4639 RepID=A0A445MFV5_ENSVE|nr:hypothetical protein BHM03_00020197 [Ensete ventricosum]